MNSGKTPSMFPEIRRPKLSKHLTIAEAVKVLKEAKGEFRLTRGQKEALEQTWLSEHLSDGCSKCQRKEPYIRLTVDHIIPERLLLQLGVDVEVEYDEDNQQVLCQSCNQLKADRLDFANPRTKPLLLKYIERIP